MLKFGNTKATETESENRNINNPKATLKTDGALSFPKIGRRMYGSQVAYLLTFGVALLQFFFFWFEQVDFALYVSKHA